MRILTQVAQGEDQDTDQGRDQGLKPLGCFHDAGFAWLMRRKGLSPGLRSEQTKAKKKDVFK